MVNKTWQRLSIGLVVLSLLIPNLLLLRMTARREFAVEQEQSVQGDYILGWPLPFYRHVLIESQAKGTPSTFTIENRRVEFRFLFFDVIFAGLVLSALVVNFRRDGDTRCSLWFCLSVATVVVMGAVLMIRLFPESLMTHQAFSGFWNASSAYQWRVVFFASVSLVNLIGVYHIVKVLVRSVPGCYSCK